MSLFTRMAEGAGGGGVLGTAIGTLVGGGATTVAVAFTAPVSIPVRAVAVGTTLTAAEFGGAVGTLTGAGAGAVADVVDKKRR